MKRHDHPGRGGLRWEHIFQAIGHATLVLDPEHVIVLANDAAADATGLTRDELVGKKCYEVFHASGQPPERCPMESMKQSDRMETETMEMETLEGIYLVSCTPVFDERGAVGKIIHIATDVTERKQMEKDLLRSEEKYKSLFYQTPLGTFHYNEQGVITDCNEKFVEIIGSSKEALIGLDMLHDLDDTRIIEEVASSLEDGEGYYEGAYTSVTAGKTTPVRVLFKGMRDEHGNIYAGMGLVEDITERKRTKEKLQESERKIRTLMGNLPGMAYRCRNIPGWTMEFVSDGCRALTGYEPAELVHDGVVAYGDLIHPDDREMVWETVQDAIQTREHFEVEYRIITKHNEEKWVWERGMCISPAGGEPAMLEGFISDITARRQAEEALKTAEREKEIILNSLVEHVIHEDTDMKILWANQAACDSAGMKREEMAGRHCYEIWPGRSEPCTDCPVTKAIETGQPRETEKTTPDGRAWLIRGYPVHDEWGNVTGAIEVTLDITDKKKAEQRYRDVVENAHDAIYTVHPEKGFQYVNPAFEELVGYSTDEIYSDAFSFWDLIHPDDLAMIEERGVARARGEEVSDRYEFRITAKNGVVKTVEAITVDIASEEILVMGILRDITQRKQAEKERERAMIEMERALKLEKHFKADAAHFFLNPIAIAKGYMDIHMENIDDEEQQHVTAAREAITRIEAVIKNIVEKGEIHE